MPKGLSKTPKQWQLTISIIASMKPNVFCINVIECQRAKLQTQLYVLI